MKCIWECVFPALPQAFLSLTNVLPSGEQGGGLFLGLDHSSSVSIVKSAFSNNTANGRYTPLPSMPPRLRLGSPLFRCGACELVSTGGGGGACVECTDGDMNLTLSELNTSSNSAGDVIDAIGCCERLCWRLTCAFCILHVVPGSGSGGGIALLDQGASVKLFVTNVTANNNRAGMVGPEPCPFGTPLLDFSWHFSECAFCAESSLCHTHLPPGRWSFSVGLVTAPVDGGGLFAVFNTSQTTMYSSVLTADGNVASGKSFSLCLCSVIWGAWDAWCVCCSCEGASTRGLGGRDRIFGPQHTCRDVFEGPLILPLPFPP